MFIMPEYNIKPWLENLLSVDDLDGDTLCSIMNYALDIRDKRCSIQLRDKTVVNLFFEPSTRTITSFKAAMQKVGGHTIDVLDVKNTSMQKGESFEDTIRTYACYGDALVIRHPVAEAVKIASEVSSVPVINAGDGSNEHPTQALLDLFTVVERFPNRITLSQSGPKFIGETDLTFTIVGDLKYGRVVHSLVKLLSRFEGATFNFVSIDDYQLPKDFPVKGAVNINKVSDPLTEDILKGTDVLYMTRVQIEREESNSFVRWSGRGYHTLTKDLASHLPDYACIMHPFPRINEIDTEIDDDPRACYFDQIKNGVFVRAAILYYFLGC